jgi:ubiquinone/menaquinone biosynthesis C-methylase UbiE
MIAQMQHPVLPRSTSDERAREAFLASMRRFILTDLYPGNGIVYRRDLKPGFEAAQHREPQSVQEVRALMATSFFYNMFGFVNRATQELLWDTVGESVERQRDDLKVAAAQIPAAGGTLRLNPELGLPHYTRQVDIHVMPGSFHTERGAGDLFAGALYDRGVYIYAYGGLGPKNDALGFSTTDFITKNFPDFRPARILDLGCGIGTSTLPLAEVFPDAEIFGVDLAGPMLRYGHARAEALGVPIHFSQQNAEHMDFEDESFDLVVSNLLFHEIPQKASRQVLAEAHRLLRPGGLTVHNDMVGWPTEPFEVVMAEWNVMNNNEPFERGSGTLPWVAACIEAGFREEDVFIKPIEAAYMQEQLAYVGFRGARKS